MYNSWGYQIGPLNEIKSKKEVVAAGDFMLETEGRLASWSSGFHADTVVFFSLFFSLFFFFFGMKWEEGAVSAAIDETQTSNVWWQAAISCSAVSF